MTGPLNPDAGKRTFPKEVPDSGKPISLSDLGPLPDDYTSRVEDIELEAEHALHSELGSDYAEGGKKWDPFTIPISKLEPESKNNLINRLDTETGLKGAINRGQYPSMFRAPIWVDNKGITHHERSPAGRSVYDDDAFRGTSIDPRVMRAAQQTVRFDHARSIIQTEQFFSAGTHLREKVIRDLQRQVDSQLSTEIAGHKGKVIVFDVETPGLNPEEGMWQISGRLIHEDGSHEDITRHFDNARMRLGGEVGPDGQNLLDYSVGESGGTTVPFVEGMKDFFGVANQADFAVGHNVLFDYRALHHGVTNHPAYKNDAEFKGAADTFFSKFFYDEKAKTYGKFFDTNQLARVYLHNLPLDEALENSQSPYAFSMQNILLQTNLLARMKEEAGEEEVKAMLEQGTHFAQVDVPIESHAFKYLQEGAQGGRGLEVGRADLSDKERQQILYSRALTPTLSLSQPEQLHPRVRAMAEKAGMIEEGDTHVSPLENMIVASRDLTILPDTISSPTRLRGRLERMGLQYRVPESAIDTASHAGIWNRIFGSNLTQQGTLRKSAEIPEWSGVQRELKGAGIPMPGLSYPDRILTALMGKAGPQDKNNTKGIFGADVNPVSDIIGATKVKVVGSSTTQLTTMPVHILEQWEADRERLGLPQVTSFSNPDKQLQMLQGDFFKVRGHNEMGLVVKLEQDNAIELLDFLDQNRHLISDELEEEPNLLGNISRSLRLNSGRYGIQVGTLTGLKGGMGVDELRAATKQLVGFGSPGSDQTPVVGYPYMGREGDVLHTVGAITSPHLISPEEEKALPAQIGAVSKSSARLRNITNDSFMDLLRSKGDRLTDRGPSQSIVRGFNKVRRNYPIIGIAAAASGVGYYEYEHQKKNKELAESMTLQGTTSNPRPTYSVVQRLDNNKINHTNMSSSKNNHLYGAAY